MLLHIKQKAHIIWAFVFKDKSEFWSLSVKQNTLRIHKKQQKSRIRATLIPRPWQQAAAPRNRAGAEISNPYLSPPRCPDSATEWFCVPVPGQRRPPEGKSGLPWWRFFRLQKWFPGQWYPCACLPKMWQGPGESSCCESRKKRL